MRDVMTGRRIPRFARSCYGHLAGRLGVAVTEALISNDFLRQTPEDTFQVTAAGRDWFATLGIDVDRLRLSRRPKARCCLDVSECQFHLGGPLGVALPVRMMEIGWVVSQVEFLLLSQLRRGALLAPNVRLAPILVVVGICADFRYRTAS